MTTGSTEQAEGTVSERTNEGASHPASGAPSGRPRPAAGTRPRGGRRGGGRRPWGRRKVCQFCVDHVEKIDYKDVSRLRRYVSDRGRIESGKKTGTCARHQRMLTQAIKRARFMALLPFTGDHAKVTGPIGAPAQRPAPEQEAAPAPSEESAPAAEETPTAESTADSQPEASDESNAADQDESKTAEPNVESAEDEGREQS